MEHGISSACFYKRYSTSGGKDVALMRCLKELKKESRWLKKRYVEERFKAEIIQEAMTKKGVRASAQHAVTFPGFSVRQVCQILMLLSRKPVFYRDHLQISD